MFQRPKNVIDRYDSGSIAVGSRLKSIKKLSSSVLLRNVAALAGGTAMGQAVVFAFSPLITRIYSPEVFGIQGVFLSLISILSPAIALRYPMAIIVAKDEADVQSLSRLSILIAFVLSSLLGLAFLGFREPIAAALGGADLGRLIYFLPLALFFVALQDVSDYRASRLGAFRTVAAVTVVQAFLTNGARVLGGLVAPVAMTLVTITSLASGTYALQLWWGTRNKLSKALPLKRDSALALLKAHRDFPLFRTPTDVLNAASQSVPVILLASLFSPAAAGLYALTRSVLNLPVNVIGSAIGNVLYARYAEMAREGRPIAPLIIRSVLLLLLPCPFIIGASYFAPPVFAFAFGEEWREAGQYAQWMSLWIALMIANTPATRVAAVIDKQSLSLIFNTALLIVRTFAILGAYWTSGTALTAVICYSVSSAAMNSLTIVVFIQCARIYDQRRKG